MSSDSLKQDETGNYVKQYGNSLNPLKQQVRDFSIADPLPPQKEIRVRNEVEAAEDLEELYIAHPGVVDYSEEAGRVVLEEIDDAENVKHYLEESSPSEASDLGESMGRLMADIHRFGSHGDPELDNFLYRDGDILSLDHEFYTGDPDSSDLREDIRLLESDSRTLETPIHQAFIESFRQAYEEELHTGEEAPWPTPETSYSNQYPELGRLQEPLQLLEGLSRTKKGHEDVDIDRIVERSTNLVRNTLNRSLTHR